MRDVILRKSLTARSVQFYGREDVKVQNTLREICAELGVSRRAVQGYEKLGLLAPAGRNKYGHLLDDQNAKERVKTIRFYQRSGFALKEIKEYSPGELQKALLPHFNSGWHREKGPAQFTAHVCLQLGEWD